MNTKTGSDYSNFSILRPYMMNYKYYISDEGDMIWIEQDWTKAYSLRPRWPSQSNKLIWFRYYYYDIHLSIEKGKVKRTLLESEYVMHLLCGEPVAYITPVRWDVITSSPIAKKPLIAGKKY